MISAELGKANVTDLRVQLYKKRQKMQHDPYPKIQVEEEDIYDEDQDSLENAQLSSSEEEYSPRSIKITTNRIVKKPSKSPKRVVTPKKSAIR